MSDANSSKARRKTRKSRLSSCIVNSAFEAVGLFVDLAGLCSSEGRVSTSEWRQEPLNMTMPSIYLGTQTWSLCMQQNTTTQWLLHPCLLSFLGTLQGQTLCSRLRMIKQSCFAVRVELLWQWKKLLPPYPLSGRSYNLLNSRHSAIFLKLFSNRKLCHAAAVSCSETVLLMMSSDDGVISFHRRKSAWLVKKTHLL